MSTETENRISELDAARASFRDELIEAGHLVPMGIDGLYGRGEDFEAVIDAIDAVVRRQAADAFTDKPRLLRFPPVYSRAAFEKTDYIASFPNLTGAISTFLGDNKKHRELLGDREAGRAWDGHLDSAGTMLVSAACHPSYSTLPSQLPEGGQTMDIYGFCFRHEPAIDPARMQAFRMHEYVVVGTPEQAEQHRENWVGRGLAVLAELGLEAAGTAANDPFFGRAGKLLANNQLNENLKTELVVKLYGDLDEGTAVVSANCHRDHFGESFGISTADGEVAHSACVGFGMERIALAMFRTHGVVIADWAAEPRQLLGL